MTNKMQAIWATIALVAVLTVGFLGFGMVQSNRELASSNQQIARSANRQADIAFKRCIEDYRQNNGYTPTLRNSHTACG